MRGILAAFAFVLVSRGSAPPAPTPARRLRSRRIFVGIRLKCTLFQARETRVQLTKPAAELPINISCL